MDAALIEGGAMALVPSGQERHYDRTLQPSQKGGKRTFAAPQTNVGCAVKTVTLRRSEIAVCLHSNSAETI